MKQNQKENTQKIGTLHINKKQLATSPTTSQPCLSPFFTKQLGFYKGGSSPQIKTVQWRSFCSYNLIELNFTW